MQVAAQEYDRGGDNYDTSNGRFTAPIAGHYQFGVYIYPGFNGGAVRVMHCHFRKNGTNARQFDMCGGVNSDGGNYYHPGAHAGISIDLAKNDYVDFIINSISGSFSDNLIYSTSYFYGYLIG